MDKLAKYGEVQKILLILTRSIIAREIVSNILMHREYSSPFPAKVIEEKDKISTENANKTYHYGHIKVDSFTPYPKNPIIANFFNHIGRADELGSGVRNLYKYTKLYADREPIMFEDYVSEQKFRYSKTVIAINSDKNLDDREMLIYRFIVENDSIFNSQACKLLNLKAPTARKIFSNMVDKSVIQATGENRNRKYVLTK